MSQQYLDNLESGLYEPIIPEPEASVPEPEAHEREERGYTSKRIMDITVSGLGLIGTLPVTLATAAVIAIEGIFNKIARGPLFFNQERTGKNGKRFRIHKFRSMVKDADKMYNDIFGDNTHAMLSKNRKDPRITLVGNFIRKYGIDELPQLWNVLKGDMSIVGPRPYADNLNDKVAANSKERYICLPGITGPFQLKRHLYDNPDDIMSLDGEYTDFYRNSYNIWKDIGYVMKTACFVLSGKHR